MRPGVAPVRGPPPSRAGASIHFRPSQSRRGGQVDAALWPVGVEPLPRGRGKWQGSACLGLPERCPVQKRGGLAAGATVGFFWKVLVCPPERTAPAALGWETWDGAPVLSLRLQGPSSDSWVLTWDHREGT